MGFQQAGFHIVGAIDNNKDAVKTYARNIGIEPILEDLGAMKASRLLSIFHLMPHELDVLVGCPPCQGFTNMRSSKGVEDHRNNLVLRYLDFVDALRPRCIVFENVPGIIRKPHGREFYNALRDGIRALGYATHDKILNAVDYGVPQFRERIVLLAGHNGKEIRFPEPTHGKRGSIEVQSGLLQEWVTVGRALKGLPSLEPGESSSIANHKARDMYDRVSNFIKRVPLDGGSRKQVEPEYWLECHKKENCGHADVYGRLALDQPSGVITSGCTNVSKGRFVHPTQHRGLTAREAARLQSFPDTFVFEGTMDEVSKQIGNAVPPKLAEAIAKAILNWLT